MTTYLCNRI